MFKIDGRRPVRWSSRERRARFNRSPVHQTWVALGNGLGPTQRRRAAGDRLHACPSLVGVDDAVLSDAADPARAVEQLPRRLDGLRDIGPLHDLQRRLTEPPVSGTHRDRAARMFRYPPLRDQLRPRVRWTFPRVRPVGPEPPWCRQDRSVQSPVWVLRWPPTATRTSVDPRGGRCHVPSGNRASRNPRGARHGLSHAGDCRAPPLGFLPRCDRNPDVGVRPAIRGLGRCAFVRCDLDANT